MLSKICLKPGVSEELLSLFKEPKGLEESNFDEPSEKVCFNPSLPVLLKIFDDKPNLGRELLSETP